MLFGDATVSNRMPGNDKARMDLLCEVANEGFAAGQASLQARIRELEGQVGAVVAAISCMRECLSLLGISHMPGCRRSEREACTCGFDESWTLRNDIMADTATVAASWERKQEARTMRKVAGTLPLPYSARLNEWADEIDRGEALGGQGGKG